MPSGRTNQPTSRRLVVGRLTHISTRLFGIVFLILFSASACGRSELQPELLPGTDRIEPNDYIWFTVSPDETCAAFMEVDSSDWDVPGLREQPEQFHLVTTDLAHARKTHHHLRDLAPDTFPRDGVPWDHVFMNLQPSSWYNGTLYLKIRSDRTWSPTISFTPGIAAAERNEPDGELGCSDCPSPDAWRQFASARRLPYDAGALDLHVAFRNGEFSNVVYREDSRKNEGAVIVRERYIGSIEVVVQKKTDVHEHVCWRYSSVARRALSRV